MPTSGRKDVSMPGKYFEDLNVGDRFDTPPLTVTTNQIDMFVGLTGDNNRLHTDGAFAQAAGFPGRIAHGALTLSLGLGLAWQTGFLEDTVLAIRSVEWTFSRAVLPGDIIFLNLTVDHKKSLGRRVPGGLVTFAIVVFNQESSLVSTATLVLLMKYRPVETLINSTTE